MDVLLLLFWFWVFAIGLILAFLAGAKKVSDDER